MSPDLRNGNFHVTARLYHEGLTFRWEGSRLMDCSHGEDTMQEEGMTEAEFDKA